MRISQATDLVGRVAELAIIDALLDDAQRAATGVLVEGAAGIGKSSLWETALEHARDRGFEVMQAKTSPAETRLGFAAFGDLLDGVIDRVAPLLATPQRAVLEVATLRREPGADGADLRTVGVAFVSVLRQLCGDGPVTLAIDDMPWLDANTSAALAFAMRRIGDLPVAVLLTRRTGDDATTSAVVEAMETTFVVRRIELEGLSLAAMHHLIERRFGVALPRSTLTRIARVADGNPFFALELGREVIAGGCDDAEPLAIAPTLRVSIGRRLADLSPESRWPVLLASAAAAPTRALIERAADGATLRDAIARGVLSEEGERLSFAHPLFAQAVYQDASGNQRRAAHERLAAVVSDPEERARHLALATDRADGGIAVALENAAERARQRGATDTAAELGALAVERTPPEDHRDAARRSLDVARDRFHLGDTENARVAAEAATPDAADPATRANAFALLGRIAWLTGSGVPALEILDRAIAAADDDVLEATMRIKAAFLSKADRRTGLRHARRAVEILDRGDEPALLARALAAVVFVENDLGRPLSMTSIDRALTLAPAIEPEPVSERIGYYVGCVLWERDRLDRARPLLEDALRAAGDEGDESSVSSVVDQLSQLELLAGRWHDARRYAERQLEGATLDHQMMQRIWGLETLAAIDAREGDLGAAHARVDEALARAREVDDPMTTAFVRRTAGFIALTEGDVDVASRAFDEATAVADSIGLLSPGGMRLDGDHAEALIAAGRLERAADVLDRLADRGGRARLGWARATASRGRALLAAAAGDLDTAGAEAGVAVRRFRQLHMPFELGRALLTSSQVARRRREKRAARETLEEALGLFEPLGARPWIERANGEMTRLGVRSERSDGLTPTEQRVAELAAAGHTNPEISARLFMSRKTVEFNLGKVYRKLGVRGRTELAARIATP